ncbi:MAG: hypothetical protein WB626_08375 [Bacteroidota bacterium]
MPCAFLCAGMLLAWSVAAAQEPDWELIRRSDAYCWGEGVAETEQEASDRALAMLIQSIAVRVTVDYERCVTETGVDLEDKVRSIVKTYSLATLKNVQTKRSRAAGGVKVLHYLPREDVGRIFETRKALVGSIYDNAREMESQRAFGSALKYYYFCVVLLNSIPELAVEHGGENLVTAIPVRINDILRGTRFRVVGDRRVGEDEREISLQVTVRGTPAANLDFSYWDGSTRQGASVQDGEAPVTLFGSSVGFDKLDVNVQYSYYGSHGEIREVAELWGLVLKPAFPNAQQVSLTGAPRPERPVEPRAAGRVRLRAKEDCPVLREIGTEVERFTGLLAGGNEGDIRAAYGADPFVAEKLLRLIRQNRPAFVDEEQRADVNRTLTGWEVRKLRVKTRYPSMNKQALEYIVLDFTPEGRLEDLSLGIMEGLYEQFVREGDSLGDWRNRQVMIKFMERYRTAFHTRDIATLDSIFADEAVIIVGRVVRRAGHTDLPAYERLSPDQPTFETIRLTKEEYLKNQRRVFDQQQDIHVGYSTFRMHRKNDRPNEYGFSLRQSYSSTGYADEGHLFLLVDFGQRLPQIYVRAWQPQEWNEASLVRLANFRINR